MIQLNTNNLANYTKMQCIEPILGAGLAAAGGSVLGSIFGFGSQLSANKTNLKIARETNAANLALAKQLNDWNVEQWNRENAYNSPSNQLLLLRNAGLNPLFYSGNVGQFAGASPLLSANLANQLVGNAMLAYDPSSSFAAAGDAVLNAVIARKQQLVQMRELDLREKDIDFLVLQRLELNEVYKATVNDILSLIKFRDGTQTDFTNALKDTLVKQLAEIDKNIEKMNEEILTEKLRREIEKEQWDDLKLTNQITRKLLASNVEVNEQTVKTAISERSLIPLRRKLLKGELTAKDLANEAAKITQSILESEDKIQNASAEVKGNAAYLITHVVLEELASAVGIVVGTAIGLRGLGVVGKGGKAASYMGKAGKVGSKSIPTYPTSPGSGGTSWSNPTF